MTVLDVGFVATSATWPEGFHAYMNPMWNIQWMGLYGGATRGNKLDAFLTLRTPPDRNPELNGAVAGMSDFTKFMEPDAIAPAGTGGYGATLVELLNTPSLPENMPASGLTTGDKTITDLPLQRGKFLEIGEQNVTLKEDPTNGYSAATAYNGYTNVIQSALNFIVPQGKSNLALAAYVEMYDPKLAAKIRGGGALSKKETKKRAVIVRKFVPREVKFIRAVDEDLLSKTLLSQWGTSFRDFRQAEEKADKEGGNVMVGELMMGMMQMVGSDIGGSQQGEISMGDKMEAQLQAVGQKFEAGLSGDRATALKLIIDTEEGNIELLASTLPELRAKLVKVYRKVFKMPATS